MRGGRPGSTGSELVSESRSDRIAPVSLSLPSRTRRLAPYFCYLSLPNIEDSALSSAFRAAAPHLLIAQTSGLDLCRSQGNPASPPWPRGSQASNHLVAVPACEATCKAHAGFWRSPGDCALLDGWLCRVVRVPTHAIGGPASLLKFFSIPDLPDAWKGQCQVGIGGCRGGQFGRRTERAETCCGSN